MENKKNLKPPTSKSYLKYPHISRSYPSKGTSTLPCANGTFQLMSWRSWSTPCDITTRPLRQLKVSGDPTKCYSPWQTAVSSCHLPFGDIDTATFCFRKSSITAHHQSSIINNHCYNISEITSSMVQLFSTCSISKNHLTARSPMETVEAPTRSCKCSCPEGPSRPRDLPVSVSLLCQDYTQNIPKSVVISIVRTQNASRHTVKPSGNST